MKASIKFRDDQKPLLRAKVPISVLGLPFLSGVSAGESKELRLDLSTSFDSGPSFRVSYRPNDPSSPFSLVIKTGIGSFGSPAGAPFAMSAEFSLLNRGGSFCSHPGFSILFKPRFGDFVFKKSVRSSSSVPSLKKICADPETNGQDPIKGLDISPIIANGFPIDVSISGEKGIGRLFSGMELNASSILPVGNRANVKFRWGLQVPPEFSQANNEPIPSLSKLPLLVMNKLSIEQIKGKAGGEKREKGDADVADPLSAVKPQLDALNAESGLLRRAVEELHGELIGWKAVSARPGVADVSRAGGVQPAVAGRRDPRKVPERSGTVGVPQTEKSLK